MSDYSEEQGGIILNWYPAQILTWMLVSGKSSCKIGILPGDFFFSEFSF